MISRNLPHEYIVYSTFINSCIHLDVTKASVGCIAQNGNVAKQTRYFKAWMHRIPHLGSTQGLLFLEGSTSQSGYVWMISPNLETHLCVVAFRGSNSEQINSKSSIQWAINRKEDIEAKIHGR